MEDGFGGTISLSADGNTLAVGSSSESSIGIGINGNQSDNSAPSAGAVYIFIKSGGSWTQQAYLKASNTDPDDRFGITVSLSADGNTLVVGAPGEASKAVGIDSNQSDNSASFSGAVYVFVRSGNAWQQQSYVKASNTTSGDLFGSVVTISPDGSTLAVAAPQYRRPDEQNDGVVYIFVRVGLIWSQQAVFKSVSSSSSVFGAAISLSGDGNTLAVGAPYFPVGLSRNVGEVQLFFRVGGLWSKPSYLRASNLDDFDRFGWSVALSADGSTLAVGAPGESSKARGVNGNRNDNSSPSSGAVYLFSKQISFKEMYYVKASNTQVDDKFGSSVSLSADGTILAVGARDEDSEATALNGRQADGAINSGAAYVFSRDAFLTQQAYVKASNTNPDDFFGESLSLSADGKTLAVGAVGEGSAATGVNGNQADNSARRSGATYIYH
jgi:trimeric autotransporter adhesin